MEIFASQPKIADRCEKAARARNRLARIERIDIGAPALELIPPFTPGAARVGDIVDLTAKRVNFEHGQALRAGQYPHRIVERAARGPFRRTQT